MVSVAQYFRDLLIGEVIRGGQLIEQRPFGSVATVQRLGLDLRYALDRSTYGNIYSLATETGHYLKQVLTLLDAPDIKKAFDANTKWNVVEIVSQRYLGGMAEMSQRAKMAESGRRILQFVADHDFKTGDRSAAVPIGNAADGTARRGLARGLPDDARGPRLRRRDAGAEGRARSETSALRRIRLRRHLIAGGSGDGPGGVAGSHGADQEQAPALRPRSSAVPLAPRRRP